VSSEKKNIIRDLFYSDSSSDKGTSAQMLVLEDYKAFFDVLGQEAIISATDAKGNIIYANDKFIEISKYSSDELIGQNHRILKSGHHTPEFYQDLWKTISSGHVWRGEIKNRAKDGTFYWVDTSIAPVLGPDGRPKKYVSVRFLMSELKIMKSIERETQYERSLIETSLDPLFTINTEGKITDVNEGTVKVTGVPREKLIGSDFSRYFTEPEKAKEGHKQTFAKDSISDYPLTIRHRNGHLTHVLYNASVYRDVQNNVLGVFAAARDVTSQRRAEAELAEQQRKEHERSTEQQRVEEAKRLLEIANKELEAFSYSVSHDLQAPLRAINGFAQALTEDYSSKLDAEGLRFLNLIKENSHFMGLLIQDLLAFSRLGRQQMIRTKIDMEELVKTVYEELRVQSPDRVVQLNLDSLPYALGDPSMMRQVIVNLLTNALKFTRHRKEAIIEVGYRQIGKEGVYYVKDNGAGFDMKYVDKLFRVFERLHTIEEFEGTGIGLALVKRIINRHGGRVRAEGAIDQGACFYFTLSGGESC